MPRTLPGVRYQKRDRAGRAASSRPEPRRHYHQRFPRLHEYLYEALDFVAQGKVKTIVETYPLAQTPKAYDRVAEGKARFRAVLTM